MLTPYRVIDLSDERGQLCGQILAGLGADVVLVEPPGGSRSRRLAPFAGDVVDPEGSLPFWGMNRGKRSVVLDITTDEGRADLLRLVAGADVLVESADPGALEAIGLGREVFAAANPALVHLSITAFGSDGPKANLPVTDLTVHASAGQLSLTGDRDRPPVRIPVPQSYHHAAVEGAAAALIALHERQNHSGLGQHVDMSAQQSMLHAAQSMILAHPLNSTHLSRVSGGVNVGPITLQLAWPCKDGNVSVTFLFGAAIAPYTKRLLSWVCEEGHCDEATRDKDWVNYTTLLLGGTEPVSEYQRVLGCLGSFFATKTKAELLEAAFTRQLLVVPVLTTQEVLDSPHLGARGLWDDVPMPGHGTVRFPGRVAKFSATPRPVLPGPPRLGEHTAEVLAEGARTPAVEGPRRGAGAVRRPLEGLKVLDFCWVMAGPAASRVLADYGATVVRIDSPTRMDTARTLLPFRDNGAAASVEDSGLYQNMNAGKLGLALDLGVDAARPVVEDLIRWADVVIESFSPKAMRNFGLSYEAVRAIKPDIVMASSCLMGQDGPWAELAGFGTMAGAVSGFFNITGWPDRPPSGPFGAYTDYTSPRVWAATILAAVEHHRRTGEGQYIDFSQAEGSMPFLATALLDTSVNGRVVERRGNDDHELAPHGVYPAAGDDQWIAVACRDDADWARLAAEIGAPADLAGLDTAGRLARRRDLDAVVAAWTATLPPAAAQERLWAIGVPAHQVQNTVECFEDPQLVHREHFRKVTHASQADGITWIEGTRFRLSRTPAIVEQGGPIYGEHNETVLRDLLGYDDEQIVDLVIAEAIGG